MSSDSRYLEFGIAAALPGLVRAVEILEAEIARVRAELVSLQNGVQPPVRPKAAQAKRIKQVLETARLGEPGKMYTSFEAYETVGLSRDAFMGYAKRLGIKPQRSGNTYLYTQAQVNRVKKNISPASRRLAEHYKKMTPAQKKARNERLAAARLAALKRKQAQANSERKDAA